MSFELKKQEILDKISIVDVVSEYVGLKQKGDKFWGLCPFHNEKTPSFTVTAEKNMFYCFGCHKGGSVFDFLMELENISFYEAFKELALKAGVEVEENRSATGEDKLKSALLELYNKVAGSFNFILMNKESGSEALKYLRNRGIDDKTIKLFNLGYAPADRFWLYNFLRSKNYSDEFLSKSGIFSKNNSNITLFSNRLIFPIINTHLDTIAFSGRKLQESDWGGKYINSPETLIYQKGETIFGIHSASKEIRKEKSFYLVEGNFDVLALHQANIRNVVAPLGTAFTDKQAKFLKRYASKCYLLFDPDFAGIQATLKSAVILERNGISNYVISLPGDKDPSDILEKEGSQALNKLAKCPINTFEYLVKKAVDRFGIKSTEGKESVFRFVMPYLDSLTTELRKEDGFRFLAETLGVGINTVYNDFKIHVKGEKSPVLKKTDTMAVSDLPVTNDLFLMIALVENRAAFSSVRNDVEIDDLTDTGAKKLYLLLEEMFRRDESPEYDILSELDDEGLKGLVLRKLSTGEYRLNSDQIIKDGVNKIKQRIFEKKRWEVESLLAKTDSNTSIVELERLLSEKKYIDEELLRIKGNQ